MRRKRLVRAAAHWLEQHALLPATRLLGRRCGRIEADAALYWLNRTLGRFVAGDEVRRAQVGTHTLVIPISDWNLRHSYLTGRNEPDVERWAEVLLRPGDIAVDVGANIGWHTMRFAAAVGPEGHVFAFEPGERAHSLLVASVRVNAWHGRVTVRAQAVGERTGTTSLYQDGAAGLMNSTQPHNWLQITDAMPVPVTTLDASLLPELKAPPRLMKIDVEGGEPDVLRGGAALFRDAAPEFVILELSSMSDAQQTLELMNQYGYEAVVLREGRVCTASLEVPALTSAAPGDANFEFRNACFRRRHLTAT